MNQVIDGWRKELTGPPRHRQWCLLAAGEEDSCERIQECPFDCLACCSKTWSHGTTCQVERVPNGKAEFKSTHPGPAGPSQPALQASQHGPVRGTLA